MTTSKLLYAAAVIIPGGLLIIALACAAHIYLTRRAAHKRLADAPA